MKFSRIFFECDAQLTGSQHSNRLSAILSEAEKIMAGAPSMGFIEPTPIGPHGVEKVVAHVPLSDSSWGMDDLFTAIMLLLPVRHRTSHNHEEVVAECSISRSKELLGTLEEPVRKKSRTELSSGQFYDSCFGTVDYDLDGKERFRSYQSDKWSDRFEDLVEFRNQLGHCLVPHNFSENLPLALWVKRQRYQYKLKKDNRHSTLTDEREAKLEDMGFIWDSHKAIWEQRYRALSDFREKHGHCNVPSKYDDKPLAIWVKCQRRQYKLFLKGEHSAMNDKRISKLVSIQFVWNPRNL